MLYEVAQADPSEGTLDRFDAVVTVTCDPAVQWERLVARSAGAAGALTPEAKAELRGRIAAQMLQDEKARRADHVVDNAGRRAETERQVRVIHSRLLESARP